MGAGTGFNSNSGGSGSGISGSGTASYLAKFTGSTSIGNSSIFDNGTNIGIGISSSFGAKFQIKASSDITQFAITAFSGQTSANPLMKFLQPDGSELMRINSDHWRNVFLGWEAGVHNDAGGGAIYNTGLGSDALGNNSIGSDNTAVGRSSMNQGTTASANTAIGSVSLVNITSGSNNFAAGYQSALHLTTGTQNVAIGSNSLFDLTTNSYNIAIGNQSLNHTIADYNIAIGYQAGMANTTGDECTVVGTTAMFFNQDGRKNSVFGSGGLYSNVSGNYNTAIGTYAGFSTKGSTNVFIGYSAGYNFDGSNALFIDVSNTATPLIGGDFSARTVTLDASIATQQPSGTGAGKWKLGKKITATVTPITTDYIELDVDGVVYKLGLVN